MWGIHTLEYCDMAVKPFEENSVYWKYGKGYGKDRASLVAQLLKNPLAVQETPVWFLGQEDPLEKG